MKLIKPSFEIIKQPSGLEGMYKQIELVGRVSHKSEDRITDNSAKGFVDRIIKSNHGSVLEFGTVYLNIHWENETHEVFDNMFKFYNENPYSKIVKKITNAEDLCPDLFISTNYRVLAEHNRFNDLKYLCEPTEYHEKRICVKFILPIGISREFCRHRTFSFMELSTRYVNMSGDKMGNEITFIKSLFQQDFITSTIYYEWEAALMEAEASYNNLIKAGLKPQTARGVLPLDTKTELYMCGYIEDWRHFFHLRSNKYGIGGAHPLADELATPLYEEFINKGYINE